MNLKISDKAPDFTLDGINGKFSLKDQVGKNVVIYFYPKDDTPGCTLEAKGFSKSYEDFYNLNTVVVGISKDNMDCHEKFKKKYSLVVNLLSDPECLVSKLYGTWEQKSFLGKKYMGITRATFLIDKNRIISYIWPKVEVSGHVNDVLRIIKEKLA